MPSRRSYIIRPLLLFLAIVNMSLLIIIASSFQAQAAPEGAPGTLWCHYSANRDYHPICSPPRGEPGRREVGCEMYCPPTGYFWDCPPGLMGGDGSCELQPQLEFVPFGLDFDSWEQCVEVLGEPYMWARISRWCEQQAKERDSNPATRCDTEIPHPIFCSAPSPSPTPPPKPTPSQTPQPSPEPTTVPRTCDNVESDMRHLAYQHQALADHLLELLPIPGGCREQNMRSSHIRHMNSLILELQKLDCPITPEIMGIYYSFVSAEVTINLLLTPPPVGCPLPPALLPIT